MDVMAPAKLQGVVCKPTGLVRQRGLSGVGEADELESRAVLPAEVRRSRECVVAMLGEP